MASIFNSQKMLYLLWTRKEGPCFDRRALPNCWYVCILRTDKKENQIFITNKEIQSGAVKKSHMRKGFLIYVEMHKYFPIYEEAVSHIWLCNCSILSLIIYEENMIFFFISASRHSSCRLYLYNPCRLRICNLYMGHIATKFFIQHIFLFICPLSINECSEKTPVITVTLEICTWNCPKIFAEMNVQMFNSV
jgi:hypothetical protein